MRATHAAAVAAVAAGLAVVSAWPAHAGAPDITVTAPAGDTAAATSSPSVTGAASATSPDGTVTGDLQLAVTSAAGHPGWSTTLSDWCGQQSCRFSVPVSSSLAWNGAYTLSLQATETDPGGQSQPVSYETSFSVAAPPAVPSGLTATQSGDGRSVSLSWTEPAYPDFLGYQVTRSPSGTGFPAHVTTAGFVDQATTPGVAYTYQVMASRQGATSGSTVSSPPAGTSAGSPPPPANDTGPASGVGGSSGSAGSAGSTPGIGTYGSAGPSGAADAGGGLGGLLSPSGSAAGDLPALPAPDAPGVPADGVAPGSDNPAVAPFTSSSGEALASGARQRPVTITYATVTTTSHAALMRDFAAVALAALLLAVVAHLMWLRRLVQLEPGPGGPGPRAP